MVSIFQSVYVYVCVCACVCVCVFFPKICIDTSTFLTCPCYDFSGLEAVVENTQDFTDSAYTNHEYRERILEQADKISNELLTLLEVKTKALWSKMEKNTDKIASNIYFPTSEGVSKVNERANE